MKTFFIADTHFGQKNIIAYENRPFDSVKEMDQILVQNWNKIVDDNDQIFHLGDVGNLEFICKLKGKKFLVKGNHDTLEDHFYINAGFLKVYDFPIIYQDFWILSHCPLYVNQNMPYANIFGHVHNNPIFKTVSPQSYCVSVERISYFPIDFNQIKKEISESSKE